MKIRYWMMFVLVLLMLSPFEGIAMTENQIFEWVAKELKIEKQHDMPDVQYITKRELQDIFVDNNRKSFRRWTKEYGREKADELMNFYLSEVIGLFIPKTGDLYVGDFIEPCKKESILAHELTHFFQHMEYGVIDPNSRDAANKYLFNEMQAGNIEKKYMEKFYGKD